MLGYIVSRILQLVPVIIGITLISFIFLRILPGDPAEIALGTRATPDDIERLRAQMGLDLPLWRQYGNFLIDMITGSFGQSLRYGQPVLDLILERLPATILLIAESTIIAIIMTVPLAAISATKAGGLIDTIIKVVFVIALSMPAFWLGLILLILLSVRLGLFPTSGYGEGLFSHLYHLFLPALVIALTTASLMIRSLRSAMLDVMKADYIDVARSRGISRNAVLYHHVLPNSLISTISVLGVHTSWIIGGTVIIETVFAIPGIGRMLVDSVMVRDYPVIQGLTVFFAFLVVVVNLITDISYAAADPRVQL